MTASAIGFICAMPMELRPLVRRLSLRKTDIGGVRVHAGRLGDQDVVAIATGMGTRLARVAVEDLLDAVSVERIVVVGITGAVDDATPIGALVVPRVVVDAATGREHVPATLGEEMPHGTLWTTDELLTDVNVVGQLRSRGVVSLDMETAAVAEVCEGRGIPWSVFRAISDRATDGGIDEEIFHLSHQDGRPNGPAIARYLARRPGRVTRLARLAQDAKRAAEIAAGAAIRACTPA